MTVLLSDLKASVKLEEAGNYGGKKLFVVGFAVAGDKYILAHTPFQAGEMADELAVVLEEAIETAVALVPVYVQSGMTVN